jgi:hydrogenase small subunit
MACTMPGFPDKYMPFMEEPPGSTLSTTMVTGYGRFIRTLRSSTIHTGDKEPKWRHKGDQLTTGYVPEAY